MCVRTLFAVALALGQHSAAFQLMHGNSSANSSATSASYFIPPSGKRVLIIDIRGPTRETGDGVRVMGMLMDLQACGHKVEVLSDAQNYEELKKSWPHQISAQYFQHVHFWKGHSNYIEGQFTLSDYDQFIIGFKLDVLYTDGREGNSVPLMLDLLASHSINRTKVVAFWDDVPFERCQMKPEANEICPRAPAYVRRVARVAHRFYVLSVDDKTRMTNDMLAHNIPMDDVEVAIWPMRLANMEQVVPHLPFTVDLNRNLVVMMGNLHAVNKYMVTKLFESGAVRKICSEIVRRGSHVKLRFMGGLADVAKEQVNFYASSSGCTEVHQGFISDDTLTNDVYPHTRAVLNPFFEDVNSGISVKNFESIMGGMPFLTSAYGMHGLSDEIPGCKGFTMAPSDPHDFASFFVNHIVDHKGYKEFAESFMTKAPTCISGQTSTYPIEDLC